jgi:hypothetical protein
VHGRFSIEVRRWRGTYQASVTIDGKQSAEFSLSDLDTSQAPSRTRGIRGVDVSLGIDLVVSEPTGILAPAANGSLNGTVGLGRARHYGDRPSVFVPEPRQEARSNARLEACEALG